MELQNKVEDIKVYKQRWIIITIFIFYAAINGLQWIEYSIINNIIMKYYDVSAATVDWTSTIYMAIYAPLVLPASYILDKYGLRAAGLFGAIGTALGTTIKMISINKDRFWVVLLGQTILASSQLFIFCLSPRIAAVWFKPNEVSTACALGLFGTQLGIALGFFLPPTIVKNRDNLEVVGEDLKMLCWGLAAAAVPVGLLVLFYFPKQPPKPPSVTQLEERSKKEKFSTKLFLRSVKSLMADSSFVLHGIVYSINIGVFTAIGPLLSQVVLQYFPNSEEDVGRMGLLMIIVGMFGSVLIGIFLDKFHKYKESAFVVYLMYTASTAAFMFALEIKSKILAYITIISVGFFSSSYWTVGFELALELTYPSSESTTSGLLAAFSQVAGTFFILIMAQLNALVGPFWALGSQVGLLMVGTAITGFVPNKLKRQEAFKKHTVNVQSNNLQLEEPK